MPNDIALVSRRTGRRLAAAGSLLLFAWCAITAFSEAMPEYHVYDGFWMLLGGAAGVGLAALLTRRWRREHALVLVAVLTVLGSWAPIALFAVRAHVPIWARFKGAWVLAGADIVGLALPVAAVLAWLALRDATPAD